MDNKKVAKELLMIAKELTSTDNIPQYGDLIAPTVSGGRYDIELNPPKGKDFEDLTRRDTVWWYEDLWKFETPISNLKPAGEARWKLKSLLKRETIG